MSTKDIERLDTFSVSGVEKEVCRDIELRQIKGIKKYGTTVENNNLTILQWLQHAYEENLDLCVYLKKTIIKIEEINARLENYTIPELNTKSKLETKQ